MNFDFILPRWTAPKVLPEKDRALTPYNAPNGARTLMVQENGFFEERVVPYARYLRAIDPAGNVVALPVSTNRVDPFDGTDYESKIMARKRAHGWLFVDEAPYGLSLDEWHEKLKVELKTRQGRHVAREQVHANSYRTHHQVLVDANRDALEDVLRKMLIEMRGVGITKKAPPPKDE